jgi:group I intron endonuclease
MSCGIYIIRCTENGKTYVGQSVDIETRKKGHRSSLRANKHKNPHLQSAYNKYGEIAFEHTVVEICAIELLNERELHWISIFNSTESSVGFNLRGGGDAIHSMSQESKDKISKTTKGRIGKPCTEEAKAKISEAKKGIELSDSTKANMSKSRQGKRKSQAHKDALAASLRGKKRPASIYSEEYRRKMSIAQKGKKRSTEVRLKMKERVVSEETKAKISASHRARIEKVRLS